MTKVFGEGNVAAVTATGRLVETPACGGAPGRVAVPIGVLVADDHPAIRTALCRAVEAEPGIRFLGEADDPATLIPLVEAAGPDFAVVAVVDLVYPGTHSTGLDLIRDLVIRCPRCRVVAFTAMETEGYAEQCLRAGAAGFVGKSESIAHVVRAVRLAGVGRTYLNEERAGELLARLTAKGSDPRSGVDRLTLGEFQVFHLIGQGLSNRDIAAAMHRSVKTIETYRSRAKQKLGATNATALAQLAAVHAQRGAV
jgi:DNA-binding NarL/FixJ family response regulator